MTVSEQLIGVADAKVIAPVDANDYSACQQKGVILDIMTVNLF